MPTTLELFQEAQKLHQAMRFADAETQYRRITQLDSNHAAAWHHLGQVCMAQNKLAEAADGFMCALALSPDNVDSLTHLGIALARQNKLDEAVSKFRQAIELRPQFAKAHNNLGVALTQQGKRDEAFASYKEAANLQPDYSEAHCNLAIAYTERRQPVEALESFQRALEHRPDYVEALSSMGLLLVNERRPEEGLACLEQAVRLAPNNPEFHNNLCLALADVGRFEEAIAAADASLRIHPLDAKTHMNRGNALSAMGRLDAALASYDMALRVQRDYINANWNRSLSLLTKGDYERGWAEYESRWKKHETKNRKLPQPRWDGSDPAGKTILLWCEQGLGDTLQFVRYAALLKKRGATVWLECQEKLLPLLGTTAGVDRVIAEGSALPAEFDCHAPLMSLPSLCKTRLSEVPSETPYLALDAALTQRWRVELRASPHFKIGIAWQGNPAHRWDRHRSFPLHWFRILGELPNVELYSLQKGTGTEQLAAARFPVVDLGSSLDEKAGAFQETAAVMKSFDLTITCDSALAHLAGALGLPVWVGLSTLADWRWMLDRDDTPWYPTMRLFRQTEFGKWRPVFERMRDEIVRLQARPAKVVVEVSPGELLDKLTILRIKAERIADAEKLRIVRAELALVEKTCRESIAVAPEVEALILELKGINEQLWDIENRIRECESLQDFGSDFVKLARSVYHTNDRRASVKKKLNDHLGATLGEVKEYGYQSSGPRQ